MIPGGEPMSSIPLVRAGVLSPYFTALEALGDAVDRLLERVRLPERHFLQPDTLISYQQTIDFMIAGYETTELRHFPDLLVQHARVDRMGSWGRLLGRAGTLADLIDLSWRTSWRHTSGERLWVEDRGTDVLWCHEVDPRLELRQGEGVLLLVLGYMMSAVRNVVGASWTPREVTVAAPLSSSLECLGIDGPVRLSRVTSFPIPRSLLATPTPRLRTLADGDGARALDCLSESAPASDFVGSVRQALRPLTRARHFEIDALAEIAHLPVRTLQRRLSEAGLSFRSVVQEVQLANALRLMKDPRMKLIDIAFELGFSDPAHFTRAFRRWTGVSPRAFRSVNSPAESDTAPHRPSLPAGGAKRQVPIDQRQHHTRRTAL